MIFIDFLDTNEQSVGGCSANYFFERYFKDLDLNAELKESLRERIDSGSHFNLFIDELEEINKGLKQRIDEIIAHQHFNAFKTDLRQKYPHFGDYPFEYDNEVYYPYTKGGEFPLDIAFISLAVYKQQVENHMMENKEMKHLVTE
ncbi:MAG: hypothetical protein GQ574_26320 [Crocinitomix sp.]|nr:hypothetical protein [Crocinitomix sp.]